MLFGLADPISGAVDHRQANLLATPTPFLTAASRALRLTSALATPIPVLMLITVVVLRHGFPTPTLGLVKMAGLSLLVLNAAALGSKSRWQFSGPVLLFGSLLGVVVVGLTPIAMFSATGWVLAGAGVFLSLLNLLLVGRDIGLLRAAALVLLGLMLGVYAETAYWRSGGEHLIVYPEAILGGQVHADVLEQAAIVNMIDTYGVASTGLDGLVPIKYHTGSLWVAQALRRLCGIRALDFIPFGFGLLLISLYVAGVFGCAAVLRIAIQPGCERSPPLSFWIAATLAMTGFFPATNDPNHWNFNVLILNNDSLLFAFALSAWLFAGAIVFYISLGDRRQLTLLEKLALSLVVPAALALIGFVKISQIYLLLVVLSYLVWRVKRLRVGPAFVGLAFSVLVLALELRAETGAVTASFSPFSFDRIHPEWVPYFFIVYFCWAWLFLFVWAWRRGVRTLSDFGEAFRHGSSLLVELVFVTVLAGLLPYLLIDFHAPNWMFFTPFHAIVAGIFTAALIPHIDVHAFLARVRRGSTSLAGAFGLVVAIAICGHLLMTTEGSLYRTVKSVGEARAAIAGVPPLEWQGQVKKINRPPVQWDPVAAVRKAILQCLDVPGHQPRHIKRISALYIPRTNRTYWDMRQVGRERPLLSRPRSPDLRWWTASQSLKTSAGLPQDGAIHSTRYQRNLNLLPFDWKKRLTKPARPASEFSGCCGA